MRKRTESIPSSISSSSVSCNLSTHVLHPHTHIRNPSTPFTLYDPPYVHSLQLWEANCFEHTQPPYSPFPPPDNPDMAGAVDNPPVLEPGKIYPRIYCQDPRIKADRALDLYDQVKEVVEW
ncbi:hypothetical protein EON65_07430 [archaeon]|nr:MAG: hypothetical protein EON65_07430 [archaeon]